MKGDERALDRFEHVDMRMLSTGTIHVGSDFEPSVARPARTVTPLSTAQKY